MLAWVGWYNSVLVIPQYYKAIFHYCSISSILALPPHPFNLGQDGGKYKSKALCADIQLEEE